MSNQCSRCHAEVQFGDQFCSKCGSPLQVRQPYSGKTRSLPIRTIPVPETGLAPPERAGGETAVHEVAPTRVGYVTTGVAGPEAEVLTLDRSTSTGEKGRHGSKLQDIVTATRAHVLQKMHIDRQDQMALVSFSDDARVECDWMVLQDPSSLLAASERLTPRGETCFRAALEEAERLLDACPPVAGGPPLKKILLLTDGHNNVGDPQEVADRLRSAGVIIQAVGFAPTEKEVGVDILRKIVSVIDGKEQYWFCSNARELIRTVTSLSSKTGIFPCAR